MALFRITEPALEPVTVAEARAWLKLDHTSEDALIVELIRAARMEVENQTGRSLITQHWRMTFDRWPVRDLIHLPNGPVTAVLAVTVYGAGGVPVVLSPAEYTLDTLSDPARLMIERRPASGRRMNGVEIDYACGYGPTGVDVPDFIRRAIKMLVVHFYEFRGAVRPEDQPVSYPDGFLSLLRPLKRVRL
ncbi:MAG: phage head-tail connector protein [Rhizobiaceae bacterium]|nr:phage head-tail connector protein [Rhizobiaceae bacterium]